MRDLELLPGDDTTRANLVGLHLEPAVLVAKQVRLLSENARQYSYNGPAQETSVGCRIASVEEGIFLF